MDTIEPGLQPARDVCCLNACIFSQTHINARDLPFGSNTLGNSIRCEQSEMRTAIPASTVIDLWLRIPFVFHSQSRMKSARLPIVNCVRGVSMLAALPFQPKDVELTWLDWETASFPAAPFMVFARRATGLNHQARSNPMVAMTSSE